MWNPDELNQPSSCSFEMNFFDANRPIVYSFPMNTLLSQKLQDLLKEKQNKKQKKKHGVQQTQCRKWRVARSSTSPHFTFLAAHRWLQLGLPISAMPASSSDHFNAVNRCRPARETRAQQARWTRKDAMHTQDASQAFTIGRQRSPSLTSHAM